MASSSISRGRFDQFVSNSNEAVYVKLIANEKDVKDGVDVNAFHPEFSHQIFGDNESIFGYRNLRVKMYYSVSSLNIYLGIDYAEKVKIRDTNGIEADDVIKLIAHKMEANFIYDLDVFCAALSKEFNFKPFGELVDSFSMDWSHNSVNNRYFDVYKVDITHPGFSAYHQQMQTFLLWFIDAASFIDADDDRWDFFVIYEKRHISGVEKSNGHFTNPNTYLYHFVGYSSIYRYYAYPQKIRPRISQFLILPPYQKQGVGSRLLNTIYNTYCSDSNGILDITVEDPSENFTRIRDYVDCKNCRKLCSFQSEELRKFEWNENMATEAQQKLKINKKQAKRVFEILLLREIDKNNEEEYKKFRIIIKQRLNAPYKKQQIDFQKIQQRYGKDMSKTELKTIEQATIIAGDAQIVDLKRQYIAVENEYQHIIDRLNSD